MQVAIGLKWNFNLIDSGSMLFWGWVILHVHVVGFANNVVPGYDKMEKKNERKMVKQRDKKCLRHVNAR